MVESQNPKSQDQTRWKYFKNHCIKDSTIASSRSTSSGSELLTEGEATEDSAPIGTLGADVVASGVDAPTDAAVPETSVEIEPLVWTEGALLGASTDAVALCSDTSREVGDDSIVLVGSKVDEILDGLPVVTAVLRSSVVVGMVAND